MKRSTRCHRVFTKPQFEMLEQRALLSTVTFTVTNQNDVGAGSLRQEITLADTAVAKPNTLAVIDFNIPVPTGTTAVLAPKSALPSVMPGITIDGSTEPDGVKNIPYVAIVGFKAGLASGLKVAGSDVINGLTIGFFKQNGIVISGKGGTRITNGVVEGNGSDGILINSVNNTILNNKIGTDVGGTISEGNGDNGIEVTAAHNTIVGNLVSGNGMKPPSNLSNLKPFAAGIIIDEHADHTTLLKNFIGTNAAGNAVIPNNDGVAVYYSSFNTIGKTGQGNLISGNRDTGLIVMSGSNDGETTEPAKGNVVQGNTIGTALSGETALPNGRSHVGLKSGIYLNDATDTTVDGNLISGNVGDGIRMDADNNSIFTSNIIGADRTISKPLGNGGDGIENDVADGMFVVGKVGAGNYICSNGGDGMLCLGNNTAQIEGNFIGVGTKGISLGNAGDGVNVEFALNYTILSNSIYANGGLGIDLHLQGQASNLRQNFPVLSTATTTAVTGTLTSTIKTHFTIQLFANPKLNPSGFGQGKTLLKTITVTTDLKGHASFSVTGLVLKAGQVITATATNANGNTSQFSKDLLVP